jgi:hypothetical protein
MIVSQKLTPAAGFVLAGMVGALYSIMHEKSKISLHRLLDFLRKSNLSDHPMDIMIAELNADTSSMFVISDGDFSLEREDNSEHTNIIVAGWREAIELEAGRYRFLHKSLHLLEIHCLIQNLKIKSREDKS